MTQKRILSPGPGCIVEFLHGNAPVMGLVLEEAAGRLRLYSPGGRESTMQANRLLPWFGPQAGAGMNRQAMDELLARCRKRREELSAEVQAEELWELAQGEFDQASARWFAGLIWSELDPDKEAAVGRALLNAKNHFRFQPPTFEIFSAQVKERRAAEAAAAAEREDLVGEGNTLFRLLWEVHGKKRGPLAPRELPEEPILSRIKALLAVKIIDPDHSMDDALWKQLSKGLPDDPHLALLLSEALGTVPAHCNYQLGRVGFDPGEEWAGAFAEARDGIRGAAKEYLSGRKDEAPGLVSIDPAATQDRDDAFWAEKLPDGGFRVRIALACPAVVWPFGSDFDKSVLRRASSLYLPEGDEHLLPADTGRDLFSLDAGALRPSLLLNVHTDAEGTPQSTEITLAAVRVAANLNFTDCDRIMALGDASSPGGQDEFAALFGADAEEEPITESDAGNPALPYESTLLDIFALARLLQAKRIQHGAVITERPDPEILLSGQGKDTVVNVVCPPQPVRAFAAVGEMMILANSVLARFALEREIPLLYRTQDVALPREYAGVWSAPHDIARVIRALPAAHLETRPKRHAGLGLDAYTSASSPLRRYADLLNQGQLISFLREGRPRLSQEELNALLPLVSARLDAVTQVQRFRPRYWKLLYFKQQGDKVWWDGVVTEENEAFVSVSLPFAQIVLRGKRRQFSEKTHPGQPVQVRLGKISPLHNEIMILESREG